ncbi:MAG: S-adenosylmethionine synthetase [Oscillospiraceae bacterium]|nr:S-adenosylmethionine synthetase [Oscillospiraceae bacterium]
MFEKVNPSHVDKLCDRIAGALVDLAYAQEDDPRIAVEVLLGHGACHIIAETSVHLNADEATKAVRRIAGDVSVDYAEYPQDELLAENQRGTVRCGDNGVFRGMPVTAEQKTLTKLARELYRRYGADGKYILDDSRLIVCQSNAGSAELRELLPDAVINPLGDWTGGPNVDTGAVNRKLGSDMGDAVTGGGLHGKDLSKADVSVNIYAHLLAQQLGEPVEISCAIGDEEINGVPYAEIVRYAREYIKALGGFERFAEWGLIR